MSQFVLPICTQGWGAINGNMVNLLGATLLKATHSFSTNYSSSVRYEGSWEPLTSMLEHRLPWSYKGLVWSFTGTVSSRVQLSYHVQKTVSLRPPWSLPLSIFLSPFLKWSPGSRRWGCDTDAPFVAEHSTDTSSVNLEHLWVSLLMTVGGTTLMKVQSWNVWFLTMCCQLGIFWDFQENCKGFVVVVVSYKVCVCICVCLWWHTSCSVLEGALCLCGPDILDTFLSLLPAFVASVFQYRCTMDGLFSCIFSPIFP